MSGPSEVILQPYRDHRPTQFDGHIEIEKEGWFLAPCSQTCDSDALARSNFTAQEEALEEVDPKGEDHKTHRFGHWGPGWYEVVVVRPGSKCEQVAKELVCALESCPVLDDTAFSELEYDEACEAFSSYDLASEAIESGCSLTAKQLIREHATLEMFLECFQWEIVDGCFREYGAGRDEWAKLLWSCRKASK